MRKTLALLASAALMGLSLAAHATPLTFNYTGSGSGGSAQLGGFLVSYSGTITIDDSTYQVTAENIKASLSTGGIYLFNNSTFGTTNASPNYSVVYPGETSSVGNSSAGSTGGAILSLAFLNPITGTYNGGAVAGIDSYLSFQGGRATVNGNLTPAVSLPAAATPEPSSLILLGTGILGLAGAARRRFLKA